VPSAPAVRGLEDPAELGACENDLRIGWIDCERVDPTAERNLDLVLRAVDRDGRGVDVRDPARRSGTSGLPSRTVRTKASWNGNQARSERKHDQPKHTPAQPTTGRTLLPRASIFRSIQRTVKHRVRQLCASERQ
jgi:hypothetical protein